MILGGDMIEAAIAKEIGLVDEIFPAGTLFDSTQALLEKMTAGRSVQVIRSVIKALQNARLLPLEEAMKEESRMFCELAREESRRRLAGNE
jgi:enoyl-CoA hydratase/carnithine racemase